MIASLKSALADALSLARWLRLYQAAAEAARQRADATESLAEVRRKHIAVLGSELARTLAARQNDRRRHERDLAEEHEQAQRAIRDRDRAEQERDAARGSLDKVLADIAEARRLAGAAPHDSPQANVGTLLAEIGKLNSDIKAHKAAAREWFADLVEARHQRDEARRECERLSAELRAFKSQGGGRA